MAVKRSTEKLWRKRLGHPSNISLSYLSGVCSFTSSNNGVECCDVCHRAKQTRIFFSLSDNKASCAFELIHCDLCGRYYTPTLSGSYYFLTIIDDFTCTTWVYLLHDNQKLKRFSCPFMLWLGNNLELISKWFVVIMGQKFWGPLLNFS